MKWDRDHRSEYVDDRRGASGGGGGSSGLVGLGLLLFRKFGVAGMVIALLGYGAMRFFGIGGGAAGLLGGGGQPASGAGVDDEMKAFVGFVLDDAQKVWTDKLSARSESYRKARLVIFEGSVASACGKADAAVGPFYCPGDEQVYIDLGFYQQLRERLGAPGDFAQAYVIAHEVGHHLQHIYGDLGRGRDEGADGGSVRVELQADCYAGVWAHEAKARGLLEIGDVDEALGAAKAIGDDTLQKAATGTVRPETFSHGSSTQRMRWFTKGLETGDIDTCNTFDAAQL
ncbi:MAG: neutral zinc metallopeptidase [Nannocystaceae bacterium]